MAEVANDEVADSLVDIAYEAMTEELDKWNIVGPLEERRKPLPPREYWNAVRKNSETVIGAQPDVTIHNLKDRPHAIACVQWHGLRAAIAAVMGELAPSASNNGGNSHG